MKFSINKQEHYVIFELLEDKLNSFVAPDLKTELIMLYNEGFKNIIVNLHQVNFIDSSGLSAILVGNRLIQQTGTLILAEVNNNVNRLIKISKLDSVLNIIPTIQESKDFVMMQAFAQALESEAEKDGE